MLTLAKMLGNVRRSVVRDLPEGEPGQMPDVNSRGEMLVSQGLPPRTELVRQGRSWSLALATASAFAPVAAWPTTLCNLYLFNNEPAGGASYVIDSVWAAAITSIAAASSFSLLAQLIVNGAAPTNDTTQLITSRSGKANYTGRATRSAADTKATANKWDVIAAMAASPSASIGAGVYADVFGYYIVPPQSGFGVNIVASTAAGTMVTGIGWHEVFLPNIV